MTVAELAKQVENLKAELHSVSVSAKAESQVGSVMFCRLQALEKEMKELKEQLAMEKAIAFAKQDEGSSSVPSDSASSSSVHYVFPKEMTVTYPDREVKYIFQKRDEKSMRSHPAYPY